MTPYVITLHREEYSEGLRTNYSLYISMEKTKNNIFSVNVSSCPLEFV